MTMLLGKFDLTFTATGETVEDVESLCRGVMGAERWPVFLEAVDNDELLAHLLGQSVVLETRYRARDGIEARPWLFQRLRYAARDWRDTNERHRTLPDLGELDEQAGGDDAGAYNRASADRQSGRGDGVTGEPSAPPPGDRGDYGLDALRRLLESGDRPLLREIEAVGLSAPPGARGRSPRATRELNRLERQRRERVAAFEARGERGAMTAAA